MTSFELYTHYRNGVASNRSVVQRECANEVLAALWNETLDYNNGFSNIEFVSIVKKMIENTKFYRSVDETRIYVFDAYFFISALYSCIQNKDFSYTAISEENLIYLFKPVQLDENNRINFLKNTNSIISRIEATIRMSPEHARMNYTQTKSSTIGSEASRGRISMSNFTSSELSSGMALSSRQESNLLSREETYVGDRVRKSEITREIELDTKKTTNSVDSKVNTRRKENKEIIDKWHSEIDDMNQTLKSIQPDVSKMLENIMGFSDKITEKYVLQFARMQIELYNFISDNYIYHKEMSEKSGNQDYINAVSNYEEFLYSLSDALAVFGVEEIVSYPGDAFDGKIHQVQTDIFSSRSAVIKKSVRSGYRYKDVVIQKEKVEI